MMSFQPKQYHISRQYECQEQLPMWTVYRPITEDYEGMWVARMFLTLPKPEATDLLIAGETLEEVRQQLPPGLTNIGRNDMDDPVIEEVWI